jgi:hypothetical protein
MGSRIRWSSGIAAVVAVLAAATVIGLGGSHRSSAHERQATVAAGSLSLTVGTVASNCTSCSPDFGLEW